MNIGFEGYPKDYLRSFCVIRLGFPLPPRARFEAVYVCCVLPGSSGIRNKTKSFSGEATEAALENGKE